MALAALLMIITVIVGITMQPPMWVMGCCVIACVLCMFLGD